MHIYTVTEINEQVKYLLDQNFPTMWVEGEISNYKSHYSGHFYFTLKDSNSQISCVLWKSRASVLGFDLRDGVKVQVLANIRVFVKTGRYQLDVIKIQESGIGLLKIQFEELKQKLYEEGLFDEKYKKKLPRFPFSIGVITSPTGAAIRDIVSILQRRMPATEIILRGVKVQGSGAAREIADAIAEFNQKIQVEVLIVGRGGGSFEDLWEFNEEIVVRAIFDSEIPVISAVGHEIDYTLSDFVADLRAPTPSAAAEIAVPDSNELANGLTNNFNYIKSSLIEKVTNYKNTIIGLQKNYALKKPENYLIENQQYLDNLISKLNNFISKNFDDKNNRLKNIHQQLTILHPDNALKRGFSLVYKEEKLITSVKNVVTDDEINVKLKDGTLLTKIKEKYNEKRKNF